MAGHFSPGLQSNFYCFVGSLSFRMGSMTLAHHVYLSPDRNVVEYGANKWSFDNVNRKLPVTPAKHLKDGIKSRRFEWTIAFRMQQLAALDRKASQNKRLKKLRVTPIPSFKLGLLQGVMSLKLDEYKTISHRVRQVKDPKGCSRLCLSYPDVVSCLENLVGRMTMSDVLLDLARRDEELLKLRTDQKKIVSPQIDEEAHCLGVLEGQIRLKGYELFSILQPLNGSESASPASSAKSPLV